MDQRINNLIERANRFLVRQPGTLPLLGIVLIAANLFLQIWPGPESWIAASNLLLHLGLIISLTGLLLVNVYRH
ncbi:MAG: hypothetical protein RRC07_08180 [Anaerolineae bacterium]|nr:hypothetical protein [Anaerolineae bacterium]